MNDFKILFNGLDICKVIERFILRPEKGRVDINSKYEYTLRGI